MKMVAPNQKVFLTSDVADILQVPEWRIIKLVAGSEYEIEPLASASGSGSRRVYDLENLCQLSLALRLLETGLRSKAIGKVIRQLREQGGLASKLGMSRNEASRLFLAIVRTPKTGRPLGEKREQIVKWVRDIGEGERIRRQRPDRDLILVPVGLYLFGLAQRV